MCIFREQAEGSNEIFSHFHIFYSSIPSHIFHPLVSLFFREITLSARGPWCDL